MPFRKKINLQKVLASLYTACSECQAKIEPAQLQRMSGNGVKCEFCDAIFVPKTKDRSMED
jgi:hypothetical protein